MSKKTKKNNISGKVLAGTLAVALGIGGGIAGGVAIANNNITSRLSTEKQKGYEEGYDDGVKVNVGVPEDEVQQREEEARQEGYDEGYEKGKQENQGTHATSGQKLNLEEFGQDTNLYVEKVDDDFTLFIAENGLKPGTYLLDRNAGTYQKLSDGTGHFITTTSDYVFLNYGSDSQGGISVDKFDKHSHTLKSVKIYEGALGQFNIITLEQGLLMHCHSSAEGEYQDSIFYLDFNSETPKQVSQQRNSNEDCQIFNKGFVYDGNAFKLFDENAQELKDLDVDFKVDEEIKNDLFWIFQSAAYDEKNLKDNLCLISLPQQVEMERKDQVFIIDLANYRIKRVNFGVLDEENFMIDELIKFNDKVICEVRDNQNGKIRFFKLDDDFLLTPLVQDEEEDHFESAFQLDENYFALSSNGKMIIFGSALSEYKTIEESDGMFNGCIKLNDKYILSVNFWQFAILDSDFNFCQGRDGQKTFGVNLNPDKMYDTVYEWDWNGSYFTVTNGYETFKLDLETLSVQILYNNDLTKKL